MSKLAYPAIALLLATTVAGAHHEEANTPPPVQTLASIPDNDWTVTEWYKQSVYDLSNNKIGEIKDVMLDHDGKADTLIIGVGGFLGISEKDVAVSFASVHFKKKDNNSWQPYMNTTKDQLASAPGFEFDRNTSTWMADKTAAGGVAGTPTPRQQ